MPAVDLSFSHYVAACKGAGQARAREAAAYAFGGDLRVRATMDKLRPVTLAVGEHVRLPRTYRGRDVLWWMDRAGVWDQRYDDIDDLTRVWNATTSPTRPRKISPGGP